MEFENKLIEFIKKYEGLSKTESKLFGEVFTPQILIEKMLDTLPSDVWSNKNLKWLDPAVGIGNFPATILNRLMDGLKEVIIDDDDRRRWILENMLFMGEISTKNLFLLYQLFDANNEFKLNVYRGDYLSKEFDKHMKDVWGLDGFDIVVGNPPYNKGIYLDFIEKSINMCETLLFVVPSTFTINPSEKKYVDLLKDNGLKIVNFLGFDSFDVNISTLYFNSIKKYKGDIIVNGVKTDRKDNINNIKNDTEYFIIKKIKNFEKIILYQGKNNNINYNNKKETDNIKFKKTDKFNTKMLSRLGGGRNIEYYYIEENKDIINNNKIVFPRGTANYNSENNLKNLERDFVFNMYVDSDIALSKSIMYVPVDNEKQYDNIRWYILRSKYVRYIFLKYNTFEELTKKIFNFIPKIDLTRSWSDQELYEYFNLTQEEINLIEETISDSTKKESTKKKSAKK